MTKQRHRDLGGVLARRNYDTKSMHHASLYASGAKAAQHRSTSSYTEVLKKLQSMISQGRVLPKLQVGKFRYNIDKKEFMPVFGKLIRYLQKWDKHPVPTRWLDSKNRNQAWVCPDSQIRPTAKYLRDVYNKRKRNQTNQFDLVFSQRSWDYLRSDYDEDFIPIPNN